MLTEQHLGWSFWELHHLRKSSLVINHKRTLRIYRALTLSLTPPPEKVRAYPREETVVLSVAANVCWSLDFTDKGATVLDAERT